MPTSPTRLMRAPARESRRLATVLIGSGLLATTVLSPAPASAADPEPFIVVGTSDVFDSNLVQTVIEPGFEAAFPQYDLQYVSRGTGAAIAYAEAGTADAMIVHAAALENQFVADGYSAEEYGRSIFWGDYVLLGPQDDPAGVETDHPHDIAGAFEDVAAAGEAGDARFVSRGGTPGTTVQEHAIWALTAGVTSCLVSDANGGGESPSTSSGDCPTPIPLPAWYTATGLTQGPNVLNANSCNADGGACYVFTDRGTYNYLDSTGQVDDLQIVTTQNDADARGGRALLINSFHAYAVNPDAFDGNVDINLPAATSFLDWITSPSVQDDIDGYLADAEGGAPFLKSAAPRVSVADLPSSVDAGDPITLRGRMTNATPGTPALSGETVRLLAVPRATPDAEPTEVASARTDATGRYRFTYRPRANATYTLATDPISQVVDGDLDPVFGDLLAPTSQSVGQVQVRSAIAVTKRVKRGTRLDLTGTVDPGVTAADDARVVLLAARGGGALSQKGSRALEAGRRFDVTFGLGQGTWKYRLKFVNAGVVASSQTPVATVRLP